MAERRRNRSTSVPNTYAAGVASLRVSSTRMPAQLPSWRSRKAEADDRLWCDCGRAKAENAEACYSCEQLDSNLIVDVMRNYEPWSIDQIAAAIGVDVRWLYSKMRALVATGRLRVWWEAAPSNNLRHDGQTDTRLGMHKLYLLRW